MTKYIRLAERDDEIFSALSLRVKFFSQRQISDHWFDGDTANARRRMNQLKTFAMVDRVVLRARSRPIFSQPLIAWQPGQQEPEFGKVAHLCSSRWRKRHVQSCTAYLATESASQRYGGRMPGEVKREMQATHDLGVSQIWLQLDLQSPQFADAWRGENLMAHTRQGQKLPDGFIVDSAGATLCVIEFGGAYDEPRIRDFHEDCADRSLPYQLW
jgi:hypothetical protein